MRIPRNKQNRIVNKEYSRLPYWTDEGYEDIQKQTSQKYIQDTYGAFAESENQLPYLSDADYQGLEYQYQNPEYFDPTDLPDVDFTDTVPKGTCYELWVDLFGNSTGAFIPTASQWNKLREYQKKCPLVYMPHYCCSSSTVTDSFVGVNGPVAHSVTNIKIHGPSTVKVNESAEYSVSGGLTGCAYEMDATNGNMIGSTFYAPSTAGSAEIFVKPWMSDDQDKRCDTKVVTITDEAVCDGKIGYATLQMSVGDSQTLIVTGSSGGTYGWAASSGSIDATGLSVTYTAPSSNENCSSNPTITLTCGGDVVDSIEIAINGANGADIGYFCEITNVGYCTYDYYPPGVLNRVFWQGLTITCWGLECNGTVSRSAYIGPITGTCLCKDPSGCCSCAEAYSHALWHTGYCVCLTEDAFTGLWGDCRTAGQKAAGCCPSQLMGTVRACRYC